MKKLISICLALVILLTVFPMNAFAKENTDTEYDQLIELACEVFPEYASTINAANSNSYSRARSSADYSVVHCETRSVSDQENLTLAQLASGDIFLIYGNSNLDISIPNQSTTDISNVGVSGTATFKFVSTLDSSCVATLSNVGFTLWYYATSHFTNYGTPSYSGFESFTCVTESESEIEYSIRFGSVSYMFVRVKLYFEDGQLVVHAW